MCHSHSHQVPVFQTMPPACRSTRRDTNHNTFTLSPIGLEFQLKLLDNINLFGVNWASNEQPLRLPFHFSSQLHSSISNITDKSPQRTMIYFVPTLRPLPYEPTNGLCAYRPSSSPYKHITALFKQHSRASFTSPSILSPQLVIAGYKQPSRNNVRTEVAVFVDIHNVIRAQLPSFEQMTPPCTASPRRTACKVL